MDQGPKYKGITIKLLEENRYTFMVFDLTVDSRTWHQKHKQATKEKNKLKLTQI